MVFKKYFISTNILPALECVFFSVALGLHVNDIVVQNGYEDLRESHNIYVTDQA